MFRKSPKPHEVKQNLYVAMKYALRQYTEALDEYERMKNEFGEYSTLVNVFYAKLDHFRTEYYLLRIRYETEFGDVHEYKKSISRIRKWTVDTGSTLLMKPIHRDMSRRQYS